MKSAAIDQIMKFKKIGITTKIHLKNRFSRNSLNKKGTKAARVIFRLNCRNNQRRANIEPAVISLNVNKEWPK